MKPKKAEKEKKREKKKKKKRLVQLSSVPKYLIDNKCISDLEKYFWGITRLAFTINFLRLSSNSNSFFSERSLVW